MIHCIARKFKRGERRRAAANLALVNAYTAVFSGNGTSEEAEIVLADLANASGFYSVEDARVSDAEARQANGRREMMVRILSMTRLSSEQRNALFDAAQAEAQADEEEGLI